MILRLLLLGGLLLLAGCATAPLLEPTTDPQRISLWQTHQAKLHQIKRWRAEGRAAILAQGTGGQIAFDWQREPGQHVLNIRTPLGQNVMQLTQNAQGVVLIDQDGSVYQGGDGETLLRETLGWSVPLDAMHAWLLGLPTSQSDAYNLDEEGRLKRMHSNGWRIDYQRYTLVNGIPLPSRMELTRTDLTLRLVVDRWRL
ncbi:MAG: lipoprotein insertase outer membrane protein LolB [Gammaproteobacteria bacterium]|nr:lipoprotein insertase outer membrane protein LolB [Gammaproteobacteria bacterium]